ncbi:hypothetical protein [Streptomyces rectiviolaceus]
MIGMDAGGVALVGAAAAVVGAALGATGAVRAARVTGRSQNRGQHVQWRRQVRRDAFAAYLTAVNGWYDTLAKVGAKAGLPPTPESAAEFAAELRDVGAALKQTHDCYSIVRLEGPAEVSERAEALLDVLSHWSALVLQQGDPEIMRLTWDEVGRRGLPGRPDFPGLPTDLAGQLVFVKREIAAFAEAARGALDHPDGALQRP